MPLLNVENLCYSYGRQILLDGVSFQIDPGERLAILGRNGEGKSTFLKIIAQELTPDDGVLRWQSGIVVAKLNQEVPLPEDTSVFDAVALGLNDAGALLKRFHELIQSTDDASMDELAHVQTALDACDGWAIQQRVDVILKRLELDADAQVASLSGGWRRRVALAQALVQEPDLLLLDEPTNHLDLETIEWLEGMLKSFNGSLIFITHDRAFLKSLATRIVELDRGHLRNYNCSYAQYLERRQQELEEEARHNALFDKKLSQEETWIRQGIKARRTRNEGRVRALKALRQEHKARRSQQGQAKFSVAQADRSGKRVIEAEGLCFAWPDKTIVKDFDLELIRGDRVGIVGANGAGKTTLLNLFLGNIKPQAGHIKLGSQLQIAYSDQQRDALDPDKNVIDNVSEGRESIQFGDRSRHIISYLADFLFTPERAMTKVGVLSGGERNRVMLAKLFSKPANLLILDEPTNDLDIETLELLEERLCEFAGSVIIVSHDRDFMDNVVTSTLVLDGRGHVDDYIGGFSDWEAKTGGFKALQARSAAAEQRQAAEEAEAAKSNTSEKPKTAKLSYKLQRELDTLPQLIEDLESKKADLEERMATADFYQQEQSVISETLAQLNQLQQQLEQAMDRWLELEEML